MLCKHSFALVRRGLIDQFIHERASRAIEMRVKLDEYHHFVEVKVVVKVIVEG